MQHILTCTTEELVLLMTLCGYPEEAKSIAEASIGEKSEQEWVAILDTAAHQLMAKQYWDYEKELRDEVPLSEDMQRFIQMYAESRYILRCSNITGQHVLLFHYIEHNGPWICHIIERDLIHEFLYISQDQIPSVIRDYYDFSEEPPADKGQFRLTDEAFDVLHDEGETDRVRSMSSFSADEEAAFERFVQDLKAQEWTLNNISLFECPKQSEPFLRNIVFFLPSAAGVWMVEYTEDPEKPVLITLSTASEWNEMLGQIGRMDLRDE